MDLIMARLHITFSVTFFGIGILNLKISWTIYLTLLQQENFQPLISTTEIFVVATGRQI